MSPTPQQIEAAKKANAHNLAMLKDLLEHDGWKLLEAQVRKTAADQFTKMRNAGSQDDLLKHTYTYMAMLDLLDSPHLLIKVLTGASK